MKFRKCYKNKFFRIGLGLLVYYCLTKTSIIHIYDILGGIWLGISLGFMLLGILQENNILSINRCCSKSRKK
ncbi:hypothetical protein GNF80_17450 [Clostridium perfringens]|nr:hypothetical protein [Clostridium perfringens]